MASMMVLVAKIKNGGNLGPSVPFFVHVEFEETLQWPRLSPVNNGMWTLARDK